MLNKYLLTCKDEREIDRENYLNVLVMETSRILISRSWEAGQRDAVSEFKNIMDDQKLPIFKEWGRGGEEN